MDNAQVAGGDHLIELSGATNAQKALENTDLRVVMGCQSCAFASVSVRVRIMLFRIWPNGACKRLCKTTHRGPVACDTDVCVRQ